VLLVGLKKKKMNKQGLGLFTLEEMVWMKNGQLFTRGPSTYKVPACSSSYLQAACTCS
jgi:xanthine dehydrogenase molybdopterin-binding subunit B